jgi:hypothetical protein
VGKIPKKNKFPENLLIRHPRMSLSGIHRLIFYFLCLDTKKQKSRAVKKLGFIKSFPTAKNI